MMIKRKVSHHTFLYLMLCWHTKLPCKTQNFSNAVLLYTVSAVVGMDAELEERPNRSVSETEDIIVSE